ncbi:MAG: radical SAM protein [Ignavibacteria bacterium RIFOXYB2_FULL_35_12]|nr:MAG: radical SAM protein [Ignavibacteria bacterium GWA2_36_19]OGU49087.1 MAG: radical SAM protein [Ignavibacteria bacterium GWC2_35_8]OGU60988.1 MAG: radical SAM protein [Ignavibacteria bacterium GWF2_35_20]OGU83475.1 MAG: radical SAM protein [Ignavibacteria bacterium RIFOXYA2_FULL_35_9]OGU84946.1 MAG: radical SAM protein [Ignavibacteria bacterium RIFOXYA12_FULL_35_25]OGU95743.1 MAG: radical SAM protein [Ignavibacteria bacterium RIFOXYB12_FULL_35_14]OGU99219.1 MAG: radical SAM protein [Ign
MEINPIKYFTLRRLLNVIKILTSFSLSRIIHKPIVWGMPITYSVEPTNFCNLKCPECPSGTGELTRQLGFLSVGDFKKIIDEISQTGFYVQLFFQGEPYLNKKLGEMIEYTQRKNIYVSVSTNGNLISARNIDKLMEHAPDKIIFSLDGLDEESYQNYRVGGTFKQADEALQLLVNAKKKLNLKKPFVELQFIVMKQNEHLLNEVRTYGKKRFVDRLVFKSMQISSYKNALKYLPTKSNHSRYILKNGNYEIKGALKDHCFALWRTAVITWDNKMVPCCFDKDANYVFGNLSEYSVREIWQSELYQLFRLGVLKNRKGNSLCNNCTEGLKVNIFQMKN